MLELLAHQKVLMIKQVRELVELIGFETRNKYSISTEDGQPIGFAAEQQKGLFGTLLRQIVGHWRSFDIHIFDNNRKEVFISHHPFRFYFQRLEVNDLNGKHIGSIERQFSILTKRFTVLDEFRKETSNVSSGFFKIWTFPFLKNGIEVAKITKKWRGALTEVFTDTDTFRLEFFDQNLRAEEKAVLLNAAILIDLLYFENNQGRAFSLMDLIPG